MCHEWRMRRRAEEAEEGRRVWDEFERTRPRVEPEIADDEPEVILEEREPAPTAPER